MRHVGPPPGGRTGDQHGNKHLVPRGSVCVTELAPTENPIGFRKASAHGVRSGACPERESSIGFRVRKPARRLAATIARWGMACMLFPPCPPVGGSTSSTCRTQPCRTQVARRKDRPKLEPAPGEHLQARGRPWPGAVSSFGGQPGPLERSCVGVAPCRAPGPPRPGRRQKSRSPCAHTWRRRAKPDPRSEELPMTPRHERRTPRSGVFASRLVPTPLTVHRPSPSCGILRP